MCVVFHGGIFALMSPSRRPEPWLWASRTQEGRYTIEKRVKRWTNIEWPIPQLESLSDSLSLANSIHFELSLYKHWTMAEWKCYLLCGCFFLPLGPIYHMHYIYFMLIAYFCNSLQNTVNSCSSFREMFSLSLWCMFRERHSVQQYRKLQFTTF